MASLLLQDQSLKYLLLGYFQSDSLEGEFGIYQQMFGGLYLIAYEQVLLGAKLQRIKLFTKLEVQSNKVNDDEHIDLPCCSSEFSEDEWEAIDEVTET